MNNSAASSGVSKGTASQGAGNWTPIYHARLRFGDIKDILRLRRDNSIYKFQFETLLKLEFH